MQFEGLDLRVILRKQTEGVEVRDGRGYPRGVITAERALALVRAGSFLGFGQPTRIRYIQATAGRTGLLGEDSVTTVGPEKHRREHHKQRSEAYGRQSLEN
jgi:hypothetical protein